MSKAAKDVASKPRGRPAAGFEITPAMVAAGVEAWKRWRDNEDYDDRNMVISVYKKMRKIELRSRS